MSSRLPRPSRRNRNDRMNGNGNRCSTTRLLFLLVSFALTSRSSYYTVYAEEGNNNNNNNYNNANYLSSLQQGACFNTKVVEDNDDGQEGNSYFYNGAYRAQYERYIGFTACTSEGGDGDGTSKYEVCSMYVSDLEDFVQPAAQYLEYYCSTCDAKCRRNLRWLENDEGQDENYAALSVDCTTCSNTCWYRKNDQANEVNMLECQQQSNYNNRRRLDDGGGNNNGNGIQYYTAPGCSNGRVVIGTFYDDECSIKASFLQEEFPLFEALANLKFDCSTNNDICQTLVATALANCASGNSNDSDITRLCRSAANASRTRTFAVKKRWYQRPGRVLALLVFLGLATGGLAFLAYTYYVRHTDPRRSSASNASSGKAVPMASLDQDPTNALANSHNNNGGGGVGSNGTYTQPPTSPPWASTK